MGSPKKSSVAQTVSVDCTDKGEKCSRAYGLPLHMALLHQRRSWATLCTISEVTARLQPQ